jgi:tetratricopeptide (TPR) repeat protein
MDVAQGLAVAPTPRQEPGTAEAPSAHGAKVRPVSPEEADVLKRYEAGEVSAARSRARAAKLDELSTQLARFEYAEAASRKAQAKRDLPRALTQLTIAVALDEALSHGLSKHGPQLRKRLAELHVQEGSAHAKGGRVDAARTAFEEALKYDADNREAREGLRQLRPAAAP